MTITFLPACIAPQKYVAMQKQNEKLLKKNRLLSRQTDSLFNENGFLKNELTTLQFSNDSLIKILTPVAAFKADESGIKSKNNKEPKYTEWETLKYNKANSAKNASYLSKDEKEFILLLNRCRMNPQLFLNTYLVHIKKKSISERTNYETSLIAYLEKETAQDVVLPDSLLFVGALCHARSAGKIGYVGHDRTKYSPACNSGYSAEVCSYGSLGPLEHLINFLVDEGVESLGHRMALMGDYKIVGVSIQPHKTFSTNLVADFGYGRY